MLTFAFVVCFLLLERVGAGLAFEVFYDPVFCGFSCGFICLMVDLF